MDVLQSSAGGCIAWLAQRLIWYKLAKRGPAHRRSWEVADAQGAQSALVNQPRGLAHGAALHGMRELWRRTVQRRSFGCVKELHLRSGTKLEAVAGSVFAGRCSCSLPKQNLLSSGKQAPC